MLQKAKSLLLVVGLVGSAGAAEAHWSEREAGRMLQELAEVRTAGTVDFSRAISLTEGRLSQLRADAVREAFVADSEDELAVDALRASINKNIELLLSGLAWLKYVDKNSRVAGGVLVNVRQDSQLLYYYLRLLNDFGSASFEATKTEASAILQSDPTVFSVLRAVAVRVAGAGEIVSLSECLLIAVLRLLGVNLIAGASGRDLVRLREDELVVAHTSVPSSRSVRRRLFEPASS